jgi:hypothetical protein
MHLIIYSVIERVNKKVRKHDDNKQQHLQNIFHTFDSFEGVHHLPGKRCTLHTDSYRERKKVSRRFIKYETSSASSSSATHVFSKCMRKIYVKDTRVWPSS